MTALRVVLFVTLVGQAVFRSGADAVELLVVVRNGNRAVHGLTLSDFALADNGVPQTVAVSDNNARPVDVTVCVSTDDDRIYQRADVATSVGRIVQELRPADRVRVLITDNGVRDASGWLTGGSTYRLGALRAGFPGTMDDAVILAMAHRAEPGRGTLVVGISNWRWAAIADAAMVADVARKSSAVLQIIVVKGWRVTVTSSQYPGYSNQLFPRGIQHAGNRAANLRAAAAATAGQFTEARGANPVYDAVTKAIADFRDSYELYYTPTGVTRSGWHDITVTVPSQPRATVRTRSGYYVK